MDIGWPVEAVGARTINELVWVRQWVAAEAPLEPGGLVAVAGRAATNAGKKGEGKMDWEEPNGGGREPRRCWGRRRRGKEAAAGGRGGNRVPLHGEDKVGGVEEMKVDEIRSGLLVFDLKVQ